MHWPWWGWLIVGILLGGIGAYIVLGLYFAKGMRDAM